MIHESFDRLVVVSNRLPVVLKWEHERWSVRAGAGGLVTALAPVLSRNGGVWMGWPGTSEQADVHQPLREFSESQGYLLHPVILNAEDVHGYYYGFSNEVLWPLLHGFHTHCNFKLEYWEKYQKVNNRFAQEILRVTTENDYVWVHDYHLMCVAREINRGLSHRKCGFFLHIPFPGPEIFLKLPWRRAVLGSLLEYDLIGFQTSQDLRNFVRCLECLCSNTQVHTEQNLAWIACGDKEVKAGTFPISIDFEEFAELAASKEVSNRTDTLHLLHPDQQVILGVDRLDYTKGILQRLEAIRQALIRFPDLKGKIALLQVLVPSREEVPEYQALKEHIERLVGEINGQFTEPGWIPVHYLYRSLPRADLVSFYLAAEMALITPLWDGMNLVAKEYCVCNYREDGVLILSEFAGAASQLYSDAILVNPYDVNAVADAIRRAYYMHTSERQSRMRRLRQTIKTYDIHFWLDSFLQAAFDSRPQEVPMAGFSTFLSSIDRL